MLFDEAPKQKFFPAPRSTSTLASGSPAFLGSARPPQFPDRGRCRSRCRGWLVHREGVDAPSSSDVMAQMLPAHVPRCCGEIARIRSSSQLSPPGPGGGAGSMKSTSRPCPGIRGGTPGTPARASVIMLSDSQGPAGLPVGVPVLQLLLAERFDGLDVLVGHGVEDLRHQCVDCGVEYGEVDLPSAAAPCPLPTPRPLFPVVPAPAGPIRRGSER